MYNQTYYQSPLGRLLLVSYEDCLVGLWIEGQKYYMGKIKELLMTAQCLINENERLKKEIEQLKNKVADLELKELSRDTSLPY